MSSSNWCTIESDPGVFSELISLFGVQNVEVEEIYSLDPNEQRKEKSYGLIFLFKWRQETDSRPVLDPYDVPELFFAKQIVSNACATQAIISVLMNAEGVDIGSTLGDLKSFAGSLDAESRGITLGNSDVLRTAHNSFAHPEPFLPDESQRPATADDDVHHFIAYIPYQGKVYELDGLKTGPILLGYCENPADWWSVAKPAIEERMHRYSSSETHFALLSIGEKRSTVLEAEIHSIAARVEAIDLAITAGAGSDIGDAGLISQKENALAEIANLRNELADEASKHDRQKAENIRRRHNYVPFTVTLLKALAKSGKLQGLLSAAEQRKEAHIAAAAAKKNNKG